MSELSEKRRLHPTMGKEVRDFHLAVGRKVEAFLEEKFPTDDSMADAFFTGCAVVYYPVKIDETKPGCMGASQAFAIRYPDDVVDLGDKP